MIAGRFSFSHRGARGAACSRRHPMPGGEGGSSLRRGRARVLLPLLKRSQLVQRNLQRRREIVGAVESGLDFRNRLVERGVRRRRWGRRRRRRPAKGPHERRDRGDGRDGLAVLAEKSIRKPDPALVFAKTGDTPTRLTAHDPSNENPAVAAIPFTYHESRITCPLSPVPCPLSPAACHFFKRVITSCKDLTQGCCIVP